MKKLKVWRHTIFTPPPPVTNCHTFSDPLPPPPPLERDILYGRPLIENKLWLMSYDSCSIIITSSLFEHVHDRTILLLFGDQWDRCFVDCEIWPWPAINSDSSPQLRPVMPNPALSCNIWTPPCHAKPANPALSCNIWTPPCHAKPRPVMQHLNPAMSCNIWTPPCHAKPRPGMPNPALSCNIWK